MGVMKLFSSSSFDSNNDNQSIRHFSDYTENSSCSVQNYQVEKNVNPQPDNYKILKHEQIKNNLLVLIKYLDCVNFEGNKILVFENCSIKDLKKQKLIDPHFSDNKKYLSPIARFEPTEKGYEMAKKFMEIIN